MEEAVGPPLSFSQAFAVIALGVFALNIVGVVPVLLGALQDEHRLSASGIGITAMLELLSMGVSTGLCGALLQPARMKTIGVLGSLALAGSAHRHPLRLRPRRLPGEGGGGCS